MNQARNGGQSVPNRERRELDAGELNAELMAAARGGDARRVREVLAQGADPLSRDPLVDRRTALIWACYARSLPCLEILLPLSDPLALDDGQESALMVACFAIKEKNGKDFFAPKAIEMLLPVSDPQARDLEGCTALMIAATSGLTQRVRPLLGVCDPLAVDVDGRNALMLCAQGAWGDAEALESVKLLASVSDLRHRDKGGARASELAPWILLKDWLSKREGAADAAHEAARIEASLAQAEPQGRVAAPKRRI